MPTLRQPVLPLDTTRLRPGLRLLVGLSGGADSVALLSALAAQGRELGLVLHAAHLHHGLRGAEADGDLVFCGNLATKLGVPFHEAHVDTAAAAEPDPEAGKPRETIEEAARRLRYQWFRRLLSESPLGTMVATAHTLDDQAETVLAKFLRGAWTEGLSGIHPVIEFPEGRILRPLLGISRAEIETYLHAIHQPWCEDSSNRHLTYTRNRIRHQLLPLLETWNPQLRRHLAQMATLAHDEEAWWESELSRIAPQLILGGKPVRGGGRAAGEGLALDITRLAALAPALQRRLLRHAAQRLGAAPDFAATEALRALALTGRAGHKLELAHGLSAERTHREVRLTPGATSHDSAYGTKVPQEYALPIPGTVEALAFGLRLTAELAQVPGAPQPANPSPQSAVLRPWKAGDRVRLRYSSAPRKVKEVLERMKVTGSDRPSWPVLEWNGHILWMRGVELEPATGVRIVVSPLPSAADPGFPKGDSAEEPVPSLTQPEWKEPSHREKESL